MKNFIALYILCSTALCLAAKAETIMGPGSYTDKTVDSLEIMGPLTGAGLTASQIDVYGSAKLSKGSSIGTATILGPLTAIDTTFTGPVEANGNVTAVRSSFKKELSTRGNEVKVLLEDSSAEAITVTGVESGVEKQGNTIITTFFSTTTKEPQKNSVVLKGKKTLVVGPITFDKTDGLVILEDGASYKGEIVNGKLDTKLQK